MAPDEPCRILGIDPGSRVTGYGIVDAARDQVGYVVCGTIRTGSTLSFGQRLLRIHEGLCEVIGRYRPHEAAVEDMFVSLNPRAALKLGRARGAAVLAALLQGVPVHDYPPQMVKQAVAGYGRAAKRQVQFMVASLLELSAQPSPDAADALAVALCHANHLAAGHPDPRAALP